MVVIKFGLCFVSLNMVYYYINDKLIGNLIDFVGQFVWLDEILMNVSSINEKVCLSQK